MTDPKDDERPEDDEPREMTEGPPEDTDEFGGATEPIDRTEDNVVHEAPAPQTAEVDEIPASSAQGNSQESDLDSDDAESVADRNAAPTDPDPNLANAFADAPFIRVESNSPPPTAGSLQVSQQAVAGTDRTSPGDGPAASVPDDTPAHHGLPEGSSSNAATDLSRGEEEMLLPFRLEVNVADLGPLVREAIRMSAQEINQGLDARQRDLRSDLEYTWRTELRHLLSYWPH